MARRFMTRFGLPVAVAAVVLSLSAGAALAGEVTGSGIQENQNQGMSWCSFSGLNDKLVGEGPVDPQAQSFGQDVKLGLFDPSDKSSADSWLYPGQSCNPNHSLFGPNPNRTH